ncbi:MAG TPA: hypothetical protein VJN21_13455 [Candidatus Acidoferrales bacterium]|nr:hypothetical protein [Candidatus Acidoferrales bacterium]
MSITVTSGFSRWLADQCDEVTEGEPRKRIALAYQPFPKQREFHLCKAKYRLFGGAAGPGKSKALLMDAIIQANENKGADTLLLRRTFPELEGSLLLYFRREVPREFYRSFNEAKHLVTWHNGSTTRFGYSQSENDIYQYQSSEFLFIGIDELTHFTLRQWQFLTSRNRCPLRGSFPNMAGATNPGNIGHAWVKSLFIDKQPAPGMDPREYDPAEYAFIAARVHDNPIYAADEAYLKSLQQLPDFFRRAFLNGDWSVFAGQYFTNVDPSRNVIRAETIASQPWWPRWISIDWGFEHPAAAHWHTSPPPSASFPAEDPRRRLDTASWPAAAGKPATAGRLGDSQLCDAGRDRLSPSELGRSGQAVATEDRLAGLSRRAPHEQFRSGQAGDAGLPAAAARERNRVVTYREFQAQHLAPRSLAEAVIERSRDRDGSRERIDAIYLSPDAFARRTDEASIAEQMGDVFAAAGLPRPVPADNDRVGGWMLMYQMLDAGEWLIADSCPELIRTLPELVRDAVNVEDISKREGDDAADSARYGLKSHASAKPGKPPVEQQLAERITSNDATIRAMQIRKFEVERRAANPSVVSRPGAPPKRRRWLW